MDWDGEVARLRDAQDWDAALKGVFHPNGDFATNAYSERRAVARVLPDSNTVLRPWYDTLTTSLALESVVVYVV